MKKRERPIDSKRLAQAMEEAEVNAHQLSKRLHVSASTVGRWLKGGGIGGEQLVNLAKALHTSVVFLMGDVSAPDEDPHFAVARELIALGLRDEAEVITALSRISKHLRPYVVQRVRDIVDGLEHQAGLTDDDKNKKNDNH